MPVSALYYHINRAVYEDHQFYRVDQVFIAVGFGIIVVILYDVPGSKPFESAMAHNIHGGNAVEYKCGDIITELCVGFYLRGFVDSYFDCV